MILRPHEFYVSGIQAQSAVSLGDQLPCHSPRKADHRLPGTSTSLKKCFTLFSNGQQVHRFMATILLPVWNLTVFQIGVVTTPQVECEDPAMVVMIESGDYVGPTKSQIQCCREPRYDKMDNTLLKTCVFQCYNHELADLETLVTVQLNNMPWVNNTDDLKICGIEAYSFWIPIYQVLNF